MFYKGTAGALLVFDLSRKNSFEEITEWHEKLIKTC